MSAFFDSHWQQIRWRRHATLACIAFLTLFSLPLQAGETRMGISSGEIQGALYSIAKPVNWNGKVLVFAHGLRPETEPLRADINTERLLYSALLDEGWLIATTSYRRNGIIIGDAIEDLDLLRLHMTETHGEPGRVVVMGDSMGGIIGALIAERHADDYDAVLAVGAAIRLEINHGPLSLNFDPRIPVLFLTNRSEIAGPRDYVERSSQATVPPALWRVDRDGHVNVNDQERLAAVRALDHYLDHGELERRRDGTISIAANSTARFFDNSAQGTIAAVTENHGNIFTSLVPEDLAQLGIETGDYFNLTVRDQTVRVLLGSNYGDVERGEWIGILRAEGVLMIARNRESACRALGCETGDTATISSAE